MLQGVSYQYTSPVWLNPFSTVTAAQEIVTMNTLHSSVKRGLLVHGRCLKDVDRSGLLCFQTTMVVVELGVDTVMRQTALCLPLDVVVPGVLGESPVYKLHLVSALPEKIILVSSIQSAECHAELQKEETKKGGIIMQAVRGHSGLQACCHIKGVAAGRPKLCCACRPEHSHDKCALASL